MASNPKGNVTWCIGKDTTGAFSPVVKLYNTAHPSVHVTLLELPTSADQQRTQLVQREQLAIRCRFGFGVGRVRCASAGLESVGGFLNYRI